MGIVSISCNHLMHGGRGGTWMKTSIDEALHQLMSSSLYQTGFRSIDEAIIKGIRAATNRVHHLPWRLRVGEITDPKRSGWHVLYWCNALPKKLQVKTWWMSANSIPDRKKDVSNFPVWSPVGDPKIENSKYLINRHGLFGTRSCHSNSSCLKEYFLY